MRYERTYHFSAAHFTSPSGYELLWRVVDGEQLSPSQLRTLLEDIHGHNYKVDVTVNAEVQKMALLISDIELTRCVMQWSGVNLPLHDDFVNQRIRATTENIARILANKVEKLVLSTPCQIKITVWETQDIAVTEERVVDP
jgi:6-pyruvoyl-tetrahydropterin synthase